MIITYKNYEIEIGEHSFDLYQTRPPKQSHLTKGTEEIRCCHGYFSKLPGAIRKIVQLDLSSRDETVSLSNFVEQYQSLLTEIEDKLNL
jgi:hypothetical protein